MMMMVVMMMMLMMMIMMKTSKRGMKMDNDQREAILENAYDGASDSDVVETGED